MREDARLRMKVWQKTYLFTLLLFLAAMYLGLLALGLWLYRGSTAASREACDNESFAIVTALENAFSKAREEERAMVVRRLASHYAPRGLRIAVFSEGNPLFSNLHAGYQYYFAEEAYTVHQIRAEDGAVVLRLVEGMEDGLVFVLHKDISDEHRLLVRQFALLTFVGLGAGNIMAAALYLSMRRINRPVDNLAHELRTPLTVIRGYAEFLQAAQLSEAEHYEATQYIIDESRRLSDISEKLLIMANLRDGDINRESVSLADLAAHAKRTFPTLAEEGIPCTVQGDSALLQSLLNNLVGNAVRASRAKDPVRLQYLANGFRIIDCGCGMTQEQLKNVNDTSRESSRSGAQGNGIGIPLCHRIAKLHDASLRFYENGAGGTTAEVLFTTR